MRNRDVTKETWEPGLFLDETKGGWIVSIGADMSVGITACVKGGQSTMCMTKTILDEIVGAYEGWVDNGLWKGEEDKYIYINRDSGKWQFVASHKTYISLNRSRKKPSVLIAHSFPDEYGGRTVVFFINRRDFDEIVKWYNEEV